MKQRCIFNNCFIWTGIVSGLLLVYFSLYFTDIIPRPASVSENRSQQTANVSVQEESLDISQSTIEVSTTEKTETFSNNDDIQAFFGIVFSMFGLWLSINIFLPEFILKQEIKKYTEAVMNEKFLKEYGNTLKRKDAHASRMTAYLCVETGSPIRSLSWALRATNEYLADEYIGNVDFAVELLPIVKKASCDILLLVFSHGFENEISEYLEKGGILSFDEGELSQRNIAQRLNNQITKELLNTDEKKHYYNIFERIFREIIELHYRISLGRYSSKYKEYKIMEMTDRVKDVLLNIYYVRNNLGSKNTEIDALKKHFSSFTSRITNSDRDLSNQILCEVFNCEK